MPKSIDVGVGVTAGAAASPVPLNVEVTDATPPPNDWVSVAERAPLVVGLKVVEMMQVALVASAEPQPVEKPKSPGVVPVIVGVFNVSDVFPVFARVS